MTKLIELLTETLNSLEVGEGIDDLGTGIGNLKAAIAIINDASRVKQETADPAAILGAAMSLHTACHKMLSVDEDSLSDAYSGFDEFMRQCMRVANLFEAWACDHVNFDETDEVWPYMLEDNFGTTVMELLAPTELTQFTEAHCVKIAAIMKLNLI